MKAPAARGTESIPLEIPPGTLTPVSLLDPAAGSVSTSEAPTAAPPDTQGDVGPNHYVQWTNIAFAIYDKSGNTLMAPTAGNTLWTGFGGTCERREGLLLEVLVLAELLAQGRRLAARVVEVVAQPVGEVGLRGADELAVADRHAEQQPDAERDQHRHERERVVAEVEHRDLRLEAQEQLELQPEQS